MEQMPDSQMNQMGGNGMPQDPFGGEETDMQNNSGESEFDTGFDAGVEADEDTDPKKFIQQLTGKLSQSLNKYNNENGDDGELSKYVGKMIVKAAAKGMDENGKKDLIKSINTTESPEDETPQNTDNEAGMNDEELPMDDNMGLNECVFRKQEINGLMESLNQELTNTGDEGSIKSVEKQKKTKKSPFKAKDFIKK